MMNTEVICEKKVVLTTGVRLRNAREKLGLSQQAVAERLCLKVSMVRDIEEDQAPADLAWAFLRGYIRSYAKLVNIPENELITMTENQAPVIWTSQCSPIQSFPLVQRLKRRDGWLITFTWLVVFIIIGLIGAWWWQNRQAQRDEIIPMADQSVSEQDDIKKNGEKSIVLNTDGSSIVRDVLQTLKAPPQDATLANTTTSSANLLEKDGLLVSFSNLKKNTKVHFSDNDSGGIQSLPSNQAANSSRSSSNALVMNFTDDCWLEITNAKGEKLFSGLQRRDEVLNLTGQSFYHLKIGAPSAVQIQFQGKPIDLSTFVKDNQVAHLTVHGE